MSNETNSARHLTLPPLFSDHMVLQRDADVVIWGEAVPGDIVRVHIADHVLLATTSQQGAWRVTLPPMPAGGPYELSVTTSSSAETLALKDVLFGELWLCAGQSNMEWPLIDADSGPALLDQTADQRVRLFKVPRSGSDFPVRKLSAKWEVSRPSSIQDFSAVAYFMGQELIRELDVPIGLIDCSYSGSPAQAWLPKTRLQSEESLAGLLDDQQDRQKEYEDAIRKWSQVKNRAAAVNQSVPARPEYPRINHNFEPARLWHGMLEPLMPFQLAGVAWYQGESNTENPQQYAKLLPMLMAEWRRGFEQPDLPFIIIQLASYSDPSPTQRFWPEIREVQANVADLDANAGLVVTIDVGNPVDIHPTNKQAVGKRAADWALHHHYGKDAPPSGPILDHVSLVGSNVHLVFQTHGLALCTSDGNPPRGFAIGNDAGWWAWAEAVIDENTVIINYANMDNPKYIRYGWDENPSWANLCDKNGEPARPFRSDTPSWITPVKTK